MRTLIAACALLLCSSAFAGEVVTDIDMKVRICAGTLNLEHKLRKELGGSSSGITITQADYEDLLADAQVSRSAFDSTASSILGTWWSTLPSTMSDDAKAALFELFVHIAAADD